MATESPIHLSSGNWAVPKRSDSAPPVIEGSWTALTNLLGEHNLNSLNESEEEQLRSSPAYLDYYNSRGNLNPRLPPPLIKREGRHLLHRVFNHNNNNNDSNVSNNDGDNEEETEDVKRSVLSTHEEETEDEKSPRNNDELSQSISPPFEAEIASSFTPSENPKPNPSFSSSPSSSISSAKSKPLIITPDTKPLVVTDLAKLETEMKGLAVNFPKGLNVNLQNPLPVSPLPVQHFPQQLRDSSILHQNAHIPISNPFYNNLSNNLPNFGPGLFYPPTNLNPNLNPNPNSFFPPPQYNLPNYPPLSPLNPNFINPQILSSPNFPPQSPINSFYNPIPPPVQDPNFIQFIQNYPIANPYNSNMIKSPNSMDPFSPRPVSLNPNPFRKISGAGLQNYQQAPPVVMTSSRSNNNNNLNLRGEFRNLNKFEDLSGNITPGGKPFSFLEELKSNRNRRFELADISGRIVEFSADQHGSRFIQQKLEVSNPSEKSAVFNEILPHATSLMTDVFGNYVIQKFFEYGSKEQRRELGNKLVGHILPLSLQMYGCRVIQKALEVIELDQKVSLVQELEGHEMHCVRDQNGNHVIQKCIECVPALHIGFVVTAFKGQVAGLSMHPYGCRVIQRVLEHCTNDPLGQCIVDEILESACTLAQDQYGNYVTQHVLEKGKPGERSEIIKKLAGQVVLMSQNKYASNVIEKCFQHGSNEERDLLICGIIEQTEGNDNLLVMMKDQFANYVVQKMLDTCTAHQRDILLNRVKTHLPALRKYTYGKHIVARVDQLLSQGNNVYGA